MKYLVIIIMLMLGGCVLLEKDTPTPVVPAPTPTQEVYYNEPLNDNFSFEFAEKHGHVERIDNRTVYTPFSWLVTWIPNEQISDPNPHPDVFARDGAVRFEVSNRGGAFGLKSSVFCRGRCIVVAEYDASIKPTSGSFLKSTDYYGYCRLDDEIVTHRIDGVQTGDGEFICVFEVKEPRLVRFDALLNMTWQVVEGHIDFTEIRAEQVSTDDYEDSVIQLP